MNALILHLKLETPTLFTGVANGEENSSQTLPYIPGSALRGALVARYMKSNSAAKDLPVDDESKTMFFSESVRFLNAYPDCDDWKRSLPTPASWRKRKNDEATDCKVKDYALVEPDDDFDSPVRKPFAGYDDEDDEWVVCAPGEYLLTHIGGEERGKVEKGNNVVFQYQSLSAGERFIGVILADNDNQEHLKKIKSLLEQNRTLVMGRSHGASYGRLSVDVLEEPDWREYEDSGYDNTTIITLLSDAILRDEEGQPTLDLDAYLRTKLNKPDIKHEKAFVRNAVVGGFNRKWGLPLSQSPALGMGSVFVYDAAVLSPQDLDNLIASGIGERRVEGFGRIAVNWQGVGNFGTKPRAESGPKDKNVPLSDDSKKLALKMAERLLRQKLDSRLIEKSQLYAIKGDITNHQLGRLRNVIRNAINQENFDLASVKNFMGNLKQNAQDQYRKPRVQLRGQGAERLIDWLQQRLDKDDGLTQLGFTETDVKSIAGQKPGLDKFKTEYTLRFLDAVIDRRMKENRE